MAEIHCPICNRPNDANADRCWFCQAVLPKNDETSSQPASDWLDSFRDDSTPPADETKEPVNSPEPNPDDVPDWLARIRMREQEEHQQLSGSGEESPVDDEKDEIPDWLKEIHAGGSAKKSEAELPQSPSPKPDENVDNEDWLNSLSNWQPKPVDSEPGETTTPAENQTPAAPENISLPQEEPLETTDSDWLKSFMQEPSSPSEAIPADSTPETPTPPVQNEVPSTTAPLPPEEEEPPQTAVADAEPDWLSDFKELNPEQDLAGQVIPASREEPKEKPAFDDNDLLAWMDKQKQEPAQPQPATPEPEPAEEVTLETPAEPILPIEEALAAEPSEPIEKASLPPWLQALRPEKKTKKPPADNATLEHNPLADIQGALLQDTVQQFYTRPQTYGPNLTVTDQQKKHAQILQNLSEANRWDDKEAAEEPESNAWFWRLIVGLILLVAVLLPNFLKTLPVSLPRLYPPETVQMFNGLNALTPQTPVLVAADFDGSLFGELSLSSQSVLEHLMQRNVPIATLSTTANGSTLIQQVLQKAQLDQPGYSESNLINLGYLPGGSMGLQALATDPISAMPKDTSMQDAWAQPSLQSIHALSDFGALVVITENADTARFWIEQVQPVLGKTPLYVIISAQSAPLLQPYYDSKQISGYLAGLNSAAVYEQLLAQNGAAVASYPAYQLGLLVVTALIVIGGIVTLVLPQNKTKKGSPRS